MDYKEIFHHIALETSAAFRHEYEWWVVADIQFAATNEWHRHPQGTVKYALTAALKRYPEEYNLIFAPFFTEDEINNMGIKEAV